MGVTTKIIAGNCTFVLGHVASGSLKPSRILDLSLILNLNMNPNLILPRFCIFEFGIPQPEYSTRLHVHVVTLDNSTYVIKVPLGYTAAHSMNMHTYHDSDWP